jgi:ribosomal protein L11 methyltransferase
MMDAEDFQCGKLTASPTVTQRMYLWRRLATPRWWSENEEILRAQFGNKLAVIERTDRKRLQIEIACDNPQPLKKFGGRARKLSRDWLKRILRKERTKPIRVGDRKLIIPAGTAFGTGTHATTAMSLRLLVRVIRFWGAQAAGLQTPAARRSYQSSASRRTGQAGRLCSPDLVVDLGTGSGILALAARCLGARRVVAVDIDPIAISTAKENARRNNIDNVSFRLADVQRWKPSRAIDIITANLFSELLIEILPKLKRARWLILSGILREQERDLVRALKRNKINLLELRRRGKWVAVLAAVS